MLITMSYHFFPSARWVKNQFGLLLFTLSSLFGFFEGRFRDFGSVPTREWWKMGYDPGLVWRGEAESVACRNW